MVERFHRQLKASLKASPHPERWTDMLHLALLGIRTTLKEDLKCTAAELVYGTSLRLPGEFIVPCSASAVDPASYVTQLKGAMQCTPTRRQSHSRRHADNSLSSASHVCLFVMTLSRNRCSSRTMDPTLSWIGLTGLHPGP